MRTRHLAAASVVVLGLLVSTISAAPPQLSDPPSEQEIAARAQYWMEQIATGEPHDVAFAADNVITDFETFSETQKYPGVQYEMAGVVADGVSELLANVSDEDELRSVREINAARALAGLRQARISLTLDELIVYANPGVRYYGWVGYGLIRNLCLQNERLRERLIASLAAHAGAEASGVAVGEICRVLALSERLPNEVDSIEVYKDVASSFMAILQDNWAAWVPQAADDVAWADAATEGVVAMAGLMAIIAPDDEDAMKAEALQGLIDAAGAGAALYRIAQDQFLDAEDLADQAAAESNEQKAKQLAREGQLLALNAARAETAAAGLLLACEATLNELTGRNSDHIRLPLSGKRRAKVAGQVIEKNIRTRGEKADAVQLGVIDLAKELELVQPQITPPEE